MRFILLLVVLAGCPKTASQGVQDVEPEPEPTPLPDPLGATTVVLDNGLTVIVAPNPEEPRFLSRIVVRAGSAEDPPGGSGMAHYLEHLLANKGTERLGTTDWSLEAPHLAEIRDLYDALVLAEDPGDRADLHRRIGQQSVAAAAYAVPNELKQVYGLLGARSLNAFTSPDSTSYVVDLPSNRLAAWSMLEGDRFASPVFRSFQTEVETVYEEKNRSLDNPSRALRDALGALLFGDHPYGRTTLGSVEDLKNPSVRATERFFQRWYAPGNMAVILAGDLDPVAAVAAARQGLGTIPSREIPGPDVPTVTPLQGRAFAEIEHRGQPALRTAWQTVPATHPDAPPLEVAAELLSNGATGLLDTALVQRERVRGAAAWVGQRRLAGSFVASARPRDGQTLEDAEDLLIEQVARLAAGDFDPALLAAIVKNDAVDRARALHTNRGRAAALASAFILGRSWEEQRQAEAAVASVTAEDVVRVAERWLGADRAVVYRRSGEPELPRVEAPPLPPLPTRTGARSVLQDQVMALPAPPRVPQELRAGVDYSLAQTSAGPLYVVANPYDDLVRLTLRYATGSLQDPLICDALALWDRAGVGDLDQEGFEAALYALATDLELRCGARTLELTLRGPSDSLPEALSLVERRLRAPVLDPTALALQAQDRVARRRQDRTTLGWARGALGSYALLGEGSPYLLGSPTDDQLLALGPDDVASRSARLLSLRHTALYTGPAGEFDVTRLLARPDVLFQDPAPQAPITWQRPLTSRILLLDSDAAQASIQVLMPDVPWQEDEYPLRALWSGYYGGSAGLIFQEVREARGLAYSARAAYGSGWRQGDENLVRASLATQPDKAAEAAELLLGLLRSPPNDAARWGRSKTATLEALRSQRVAFGAVAAVAEGWRLKGLSADPRPDRLRRLRAPSLQDVAAWSQRFDQGPFTLAVVGDVDRMDLEALRRIAPIERVELDAISR